jgi:hypothetical protein
MAKGNAKEKAPVAGNTSVDNCMTVGNDKVGGWQKQQHQLLHKEEEEEE